MNILHTSDLHLGKSLEGVSRLFEQERFFDELINICDTEEIDIILIAGDVYDTKNPKALAEKLFYKALKTLSKDGERLIIIIAGNHDSHDRIMSLSYLVNDMGIIIVGYPNTTIECVKNDVYECIESIEGAFKLRFKGEIINVVTMAYPSEQSLNMYFDDNNEKDMQKSFHEHLKSLFFERASIFSDDEINIIMAHIFLRGGEPTLSESDISLGGSLVVTKDALPPADYIALGHLHKSQEIKGESIIYYSGSPIAYSFSEHNHKKSVNVLSIDFIDNKKVIDVKKVPLEKYIPLEVWTCYSYKEALDKALENTNSNSYVHLTIITNEVMLSEFIKELKSYKNNILKIITLSENIQNSLLNEQEEFVERSIVEEFSSFYKEVYNTEPTEDVIKLFIQIGEDENV